MTLDPMGIYGHLPSPLRSVAASIQGYRLRFWRYGPETERLVAEAIERDAWDEARWKRWQDERLARLLHHAATRVPYYREQWSARRRRGDSSSWEALGNWPILTKQSLRDSPESFVADGNDVRRMFLVETSGTTGTPLKLWRTRQTDRSWYALTEARLRRWNGLTLDDRWANLGGQRVVPGDRRDPPFWVWNRGMRQLYMSTYHVFPDAVKFYLEAIRDYGVTHIIGYPSAMHAVSQVALERGLEAPPIRLAISNAEPFYGFQRDVVSRAFRCPVRDTYGQGEVVAAGSECPSGSMHLWPDVGITEWLRDDADEPAAPGRTARMICTGLLNTEMPLIRYEVGDRATLSDKKELCACGRRLPVIREIEGRTFDLVVTARGSPVGGLDTIFHSGLPMREAQIVQETIHRIRINVVPSGRFGDEHRDDLIRGVQARLGDDVEVVVEAVESIPRTAAGKFKVVTSLIGSLDTTS